MPGTAKREAATWRTPHAGQATEPRAALCHEDVHFLRSMSIQMAFTAPPDWIRDEWETGSRPTTKVTCCHNEVEKDLLEWPCLCRSMCHVVCVTVCVCACV